MVASCAVAPNTDEGSTWDAIRKLAPLRAVDASEVDCFNFNEMVDAFASHTTLRYLSLNDGKEITTTSLGMLSDIEVLELRSCSLAPPALQSIAQLRSLRCLNVNGSGLDDEGCALIAALPVLHELDVGKCTALTTTSSATLGKMKRLQTLDVSEMGPKFWPSVEDLPAAGEKHSRTSGRFPVLRSLVAKANVPLTGQQLIRGILQHVPYLQELNVCDSSSLTFEDIKSIVRCCRFLIDVKLGCYSGKLRLPLVATTRVLVEGLPSIQKMNVRELEGYDKDTILTDASKEELVEVLDSATHLTVFTVNKNVKTALQPHLQRVTISEW